MDFGTSGVGDGVPGAVRADGIGGRTGEDGSSWVAVATSVVSGDVDAARRSGGVTGANVIGDSRVATRVAFFFKSAIFTTAIVDAALRTDAVWIGPGAHLNGGSRLTTPSFLPPKSPVTFTTAIVDAALRTGAVWIGPGAHLNGGSRVVAFFLLEPPATLSFLSESPEAPKTFREVELDKIIYNI